MRTVVQRVSRASVTVEGETIAEIGKGLLVLLGIEDADGQEDIDWLTAKIANLRIFGDESGIMNLSVKEMQGGIIVVSQFTLHALTKKGNRPSYIKASKPDIAVPLYEKFLVKMSGEMGVKVQSGRFGADMKVELLNDGPVTILIDSQKRE